MPLSLGLGTDFPGLAVGIVVVGVSSCLARVKGIFCLDHPGKGSLGC
jgi:hypothetical protein